MDILLCVEFIDQFLEVCKHFKVRFNGNYGISMCDDGTWRKLSYEQFKKVYVAAFIQTLMSCDGGDE